MDFEFYEMDFGKIFVILDSGRFKIFVLGLNIFEIFDALDGVGLNFLISGTSFGFSLIIDQIGKK